MRLGLEEGISPPGPDRVFEAGGLDLFRVKWRPWPPWRVMGRAVGRDTTDPPRGGQVDCKTGEDLHGKILETGGVDLTGSMDVLGKIDMLKVTGVIDGSGEFDGSDVIGATLMFDGFDVLKGSYAVGRWVVGRVGWEAGESLCPPRFRTRQSG